MDIKIRLYPAIVFMAMACEVYSSDSCSSRQVDRFESFLEVALCIDPVEAGPDGVERARGFTLTYTNIGYRNLFLILVTEPLHNISLRAEVDGRLLPRKRMHFCNPDTECPYEDFLPRLAPNQSLVRRYQFSDLISEDIRPDAEYDIGIEATAYAYFDGESRSESFKIYGELKKRPWSSFEFQRIRLLSSPPSSN